MGKSRISYAGSTVSYFLDVFSQLLKRSRAVAVHDTHVNHSRHRLRDGAYLFLVVTIELPRLDDGWDNSDSLWEVDRTGLASSQKLLIPSKLFPPP